MDKQTVNISLGGITFFWGLITQCLQWAGVISWSWVAIWGPFLALIAICLIVFVVALIVGIIAELFR